MQNRIFAERLNDSRRELIRVRTSLSGAIPGHVPRIIPTNAECVLRRRHRRPHGNRPPAVRDGHCLPVAIHLLGDERNQPQAHRLLADARSAETTAAPRAEAGTFAQRVQVRPGCLRVPGRRSRQGSPHWPFPRSAGPISCPPDTVILGYGLSVTVGRFVEMRSGSSGDFMCRPPVRFAADVRAGGCSGKTGSDEAGSAVVIETPRNAT